MFYIYKNCYFVKLKTDNQLVSNYKNITLSAGYILFIFYLFFIQTNEEKHN